MKQWKKILVIVAAALVVISGITAGVYNLYIVPKYIEPALEFVSSALMNSEYQDILSELANRLVDEGILDQYTAKTYLRKSRKYTSEGKREASRSDKNDFTDIDIDDILNEEEDSRKKDDNIVIGTTRTSIGIEMVRSDNDYPDAEPSSYHSYSEKQSEINQNRENDDVAENLESNNEDVLTFENDNTGNSLYNKIFKAMNQRERSTFLSVVSKIDITEVISLYNMGDRIGIKEHLQSRLSEDQYKEAIDIFYKYAPLLYQ